MEGFYKPPGMTAHTPRQVQARSPQQTRPHSSSPGGHDQTQERPQHCPPRRPFRPAQVTRRIPRTQKAAGPGKAPPEAATRGKGWRLLSASGRGPRNPGLMRCFQNWDS